MVRSTREQASDVEGKIWDEAVVLFEQILSDFNSKNLLRKTIIPMDMARLVELWKNSRNYVVSVNEIIDKFKTKEAEKLRDDLGLSNTAVFYLFMSQLITVGLVAYETVFKTSLLFFIDDKQIGVRKTVALGGLLDKIEKFSPKAGADLKKMINLRVRNSLAHGTYWFNQQTIYLATNSYLEEITCMDIGDFWIELKNMNVISLALIDALDKKRSEGYFNP